MTAVIEQSAPLNLTDRCDRCGAQAFMRATKGSTLLFCGHHGVENHDALVLDGFIVEDFRKSINKTPSLSSA